MRKVFLGGTCNNSLWREQLIDLLEIDFFNPVVEDWTPDCMTEEIRQRNDCEFCLCVITPKMTGVYSIAEVVEDSIMCPWKTVFCVLSAEGDEEFTTEQLKSLYKVGHMVLKNGAKVMYSLKETAVYLNGASEFFEGKAIKKPGALRASLGIKKGKTIPKSKLDAAAKKGGKLGKRARFAETLAKLLKKK